MTTALSRTFTTLAVLSLVVTAPAYGTGAAIEVGSPLGTMVLDSDNFGQVTPTGPDSFQWTGSMTNVMLGWGIDWDLLIDGDPSIGGVAAFTNLLGATTPFTYNVSALSTVSIVSPTVNGGSTISVLDTGSDGATMAAQTADSIYNAFIQATTEATLFNDPYQLVAPVQGSNVDGLVWGPQPAISSLSIGDTFGINHDFTLTAGDQASVNSSFFIVPEPASGLLLLVGVAALVRRR